MSRLAHPAAPSEESGPLSHARIWTAIDSLAAKYGMSPSGLAKRAGLDATTFNRSKRQTPDGRLRWPSTESVAKVLKATGASLTDLLSMTDSSPSGERKTLPLIGLEQSHGERNLFDAEGFPIGEGWDAAPFPNIADEHAYALEVTGDALTPIFRDGDVVVVSPLAPIRRGDRVVVRTRAGEALVRELTRRTARTIELRSLDVGRAESTLDTDDVAWMARIMWASQ